MREGGGQPCEEPLALPRLAGARERGNEASPARPRPGRGCRLVLGTTQPQTKHTTEELTGTPGHRDAKTGVARRHSPGAPGNLINFTTDESSKYFLDLKLKIIRVK